MKPFAPLPSAWTLPWILALACTASCASPGEGQNENSIEENVPVVFTPTAWTTAFMEPAMLFADRITIEGPQGLLEHLATRSTDEFHAYDAETLPEGFQQVFSVKNRAAGVELRAYLDRFELVIFDELVVLEKPGEVDILIRAEGDVYWRNSSTLEERRGAILSFAGEIEPLRGVPEMPASPPADK